MISDRLEDRLKRSNFDTALSSIFGAGNPLIEYVRDNYYRIFSDIRKAGHSRKGKKYGLFLGLDTKGEMVVLYDYGICRTHDSGLFNYEYKPGDLIAFRKSEADELSGEVVGTDAEIVVPGYFKGV